MDSSNLAVAVSFTRFRASVTGYSLVRSIFAAMAAARLDNFAMSDSLDGNAHAAGGAGNRTNCCIHVGCGQVGLLGLGDFLSLSASQCANLVGVGTSGTLLHTGRLLDKDRRRRRLHDEGEALVCVGSDHHGNRQTGLHALGLGVERLAEFHDVQAALTKSGTNWGGRISLTSWHLQLDEADDFLRHFDAPCGS